MVGVLMANAEPPAEGCCHRCLFRERSCRAPGVLLTEGVVRRPLNARPAGMVVLIHPVSVPLTDNGGRVPTVATSTRLCSARTNHLPQKFPLAHCVRGSFG
jgi:hypothetical protein